MGSTFRKGSEASGQSQGLSQEQAAMARSQQQMSEHLFNMSDPLRQHALLKLNHLVVAPNGVENALPPQLRSTVGIGGPLAEQAQELGAARQSILNNTPRGGLQQRMLMELPIQRMLNNDMLQAQARGIDDATRQNLFNTAIGTSMGQAPVAISGLSGASAGLGGAAGNLSGLGQQRIAQNQALLGGAGQLGGAIGKGLMMCWVARRLYGVDHPSTHRLRAWFVAHPTARATRLYQRYGQWVSQQWWCPVLRPVCDLFVGRAKQWAHSGAV